MINSLSSPMAAVNAITINYLLTTTIMWITILITVIMAVAILLNY